jgi:hypothetical protein
MTFPPSSKSGIVLLSAVGGLVVNTLVSQELALSYYCYQHNLIVVGTSSFKAFPFGELNLFSTACLGISYGSGLGYFIGEMSVYAINLFSVNTGNVFYWLNLGFWFLSSTFVLYLLKILNKYIRRPKFNDKI